MVFNGFTYIKRQNHDMKYLLNIYIISAFIKKVKKEFKKAVKSVRGMQFPSIIIITKPM